MDKTVPVVREVEPAGIGICLVAVERDKQPDVANSYSATKRSNWT